MRRESVLLLLCLLLASAAICDDKIANDSVKQPSVKKEGSVFILSDKTFKSFIKSKDVVLVYFYAPWCGMCKEFNPEYSKLASESGEDSLIAYSKMNAEDNEDTAATYSISSYPTLLLMVKGKAYPYDGGFESASIAQFIRRVVFSPTESADGKLAKVVSSHEKLVLFISTNPSEVEAVNESSRKLTFIDFFSLSDVKEATQLLKIQSPGLYVIKRNGTEVVSMTGKPLTEDAVTKFVKDHKYDLIVSGVQLESIDRIFEPRSKPGMMGFFTDLKSPEYKAFSEFAQSQGISGGLMYFVSKIGNPDDHLADFVGIKENNRVAIVKGARNFNAKRYLMTKPITLGNLKEFYQDFREGRIVRHYRSEAEPTDNSGSLKKVVELNFRQYVPNKDGKFVAMYIYDDNCEECPRFEKVIQSIADSGAFNNVVFTKFNWQKNDVADLKVEDTPAFYLFMPEERIPMMYKGGGSKRAKLEDFIRKAVTKWGSDQKSDL